MDMEGLEKEDDQMMMVEECPAAAVNDMSIIRSSSPSLWSEEGRTLGLYVAYMDLAEIHDPSAAVVVCGTHSSMQVRFA